MPLILNNNSSFILMNLAFTILIFSLNFLPHDAANTTAATTTSPEFSTSVLNVTTALNQVHHVLSLKPSFHLHQNHEQQQQQTQHTLSPSSSSSFSFQLHPRESLFNAHHHNYRSLVLTRLRRDSARVSWITSHLNKSNLRPEHLSAPVTSGVSQGTGEYFARIGVGQPAQHFYIVPDTGSDINWIQCKPCNQCYKQSDPIFDPSTSSSYALVPCKAKQCKDSELTGCYKNGCEYDVMYGDGSFSSGVLVTETVSLGNNGSVKRVPIGCGHLNHGTFAGAAGILGLGRGALSFQAHIKASSFSYCLVYRDTNKSSTLEFNSPRPGDSVTAPLLSNPKLKTFYYVGVTGVSVGGRRVSIPPSTFAIKPSGMGGIIVDSGTTVTRLPTPAYNAMRDAFVALTRHLRRAKGFLILDTCYDFSSVTVATVPTVSFELSGGGSWRLPVLGYLIPVDDKGTFCFAFAPSVEPVSIIGNVQQQGTRVSFDLVNSVIGFSTDKCS